MAVTITHPFVSPVADAGDPDEVGPNEWNAAHTVTGLGTAAEANTTDFATAAQGAKADSALQSVVAGSGISVNVTDPQNPIITATGSGTDFLSPAAIAAAYQPLDADLTAWAGVNPSSYSTTAQVAAAYQPLDSDLTSWGGVTRASGFDTFAATPSSANLATLLTDETGTGSVVFATSPTLVTPALGTPSSVVLTNATGLPTAGIVDDAVTNAKLANMAANTIKGRVTASTGDPEDLTAANVKTILALAQADISGLTTASSPQFAAIELGNATDTTLSRGAAGFIAVEGKRVPSPASQASGDLLYRGATEWERLAKGTALQVLRQNSALTAPEWSTAREVLTANRTYFVRTDGSDSNDGLANTAGGAFLTIAKALTTAAALDGSTFDVTIQVGAGTRTVAVVLPQFIGSGTWKLLGDASTPSNCVISVTSGQCISADAINSTWLVEGFKLQTTTSGSGIFVTNFANIKYNAIDFGACATSHVRVSNYGAAVAYGNTSITGDALIHWHLDSGGFIFDAGFTITLVGTRGFSNSFLQAGGGSVAKVNGNTFSGSATGTRYAVIMNSICDVNGAGASYLPGNATGSTATGGQYA